MSSFLSKKRTKEGFFERISSEPVATKNNRVASLKNFEIFVESKYEGRDLEDICEEIQALQGQEKDNALYDMLQEWINWNQQSQRRKNSTIRLMFSSIRKFLYYMGIKTDQQDIKENLKFGKITVDEKYPLSDDEYRAIITAFGRHPRRQALYLCLGSSGMRIGEALKLRKKDLDFSQARIKISISSEIAKTRKGRITYISKEAEKILKPILNKIGNEDLIFTREYTDQHYASIVEQKALTIVLGRLGLNNRYSSNNFHKITSHSFRSYFFTKATRKHGENYAHRLVGHNGYLMQYDRMTEEEKLKMYVELESDLTIFDQTKNELEIERLREKVESIDELRAEIKKLRENQVIQDKKILDELQRKGVLPEFVPRN